MNRLKLASLGVLLTLGFESFDSPDIRMYEFSYPNRSKTAINLNAAGFLNFTKEWRGDSYFYYGKSSEGITCSVLYFKLNEAQQHAYVDNLPVKSIAGNSFAYFAENSNLKKYEKNIEKWGKLADDFVFKQSDINDFKGIAIKQKHVFAYSMFDNDLFVNIHLAKSNYNAADSTKMRDILNSLIKKK